MAKLSKDFFDGNEVLFVGYSSRNRVFSRQVYQAFMRNGIKVYPLNNKANGSYDVKVYKSMSELPKTPRSAYVLLNKNNSISVVRHLAENGIKKVLFQNKKIADSDTLNECEKLGIEAAVGCPMMVFGSGFHKIHGFFAGAR